MIVSILFGFFAGVFMTYSLLPEKTIFKGPNSNNIKESVYQFDDKYYEFTTNIHICPSNLR